MSDFDRNVAAPGGFADRTATIDAGLRAYMLRVYNYMAAAVAFTGVVAWFTYSAAVLTDASGRITALTPFGQTIYGGPLMIVLLLGTLGLVFFMSARIDRLQPSTALLLFMVYAGLLGITTSAIFLTYTHASITRVFFISAASFGALSLYGYTTRADLTPVGSFMIMGQFGAAVRYLGDWRRRIRGPHRVGYPADQGHVQLDGRRWRRGPEGRHGGANALSRFH
jgi:FtsH-binding integral membrane protein